MTKSLTLRKTLDSKIVAYAATVYSIVFILLSIYGGFRSYSPVPYWDMWEGYLDFYIHQSAGDIGAWWGQHNEHRIVLARILFWIDIKWLDGSIIFLIAVNYILVFSACYLFFKIIEHISNPQPQIFTKTLLKTCVVSLLFSWMQWENLTWGFQSQFFLAQLLPLLAFFLLFLSSTNRNQSVKYYVSACLVGICTLGTMANGVIALPMMVLLALVLRISWHRVIILIVLSGIGLTAYFYDFHPINGHGSILDMIQNKPWDFIKYVCLYLGGPFYFLSDNKSLATHAGIFFIGSSIYFAWKAATTPDKASIRLPILSFLFYIGATAAATAGGRLIFGLDQALSSRYQTPALMAWTALLVLYAPAVATQAQKRPFRVVISLLLIPGFLIPQQLNARHGLDSNTLFERLIAALAVELGIKHDAQLKFIFPSSEYLLTLAERPRELNLSIFNNPLIRDAKNLLGHTDDNPATHICQGHLDTVFPVDGDASYVQVDGWLFEPTHKESPKIVHFLNEENTVVGYALTGRRRDDVSRIIAKEAILSGFKGYLRSDQLGKTLTLRGLDPDCDLSTLGASAPRLQ